MKRMLSFTGVRRQSGPATGSSEVDYNVLVSRNPEYVVVSDTSKGR